MNTASTTSFSMKPIATVHSPYKEKFAIPRQPGLVTTAKGKLVFSDEFDEAAFKSLSDYSHLWVVFVFHETAQRGWKPQVRPPRLGGNQKIGVFATRSTFRPNPIGMSVVSIDGIERINGKMCIHISGLDLLDQTPVLDVKPYLPYSDNIADTTTPKFAEQASEELLTVSFNEQANKDLAPYNAEFKTFITEVLQQDPRPAYRKGKLDNRIYGVHLANSNVQWQMLSEMHAQVITVTAIKETK